MQRRGEAGRRLSRCHRSGRRPGLGAVLGDVVEGVKVVTPVRQATGGNTVAVGEAVEASAEELRGRGASLRGGIDNGGEVSACRARHLERDRTS